MAETLVDNPTCIDCGTEIRSAALFCYHCGKAVAQGKASRKDKSIGRSTRKTKTRIKPAAVESPDVGESPPIPNPFLKAETNGAGEVKLRSAASIRNEARRSEPKKIEVYWEEHENAPNVLFIAVSIALVLFTIVILFIAMYLK